MDALQRLAESLTHELYQAERSASRQPRVEAQRLGDVPPGQAMLAVAVHADEALAALGPLAKACGLPSGPPGQAIGTALSAVRESVADLFVDLERNYRGTLLGMRHGLDVVRLSVDVLGQRPEWQPLHAFCVEWTARRRPLVEACADHLVWFAIHPELARQGLSPVRTWIDGLGALGRMRTAEP